MSPIPTTDTPADELPVYTRAAEAVKLRLQGLSYADIGKVMKISRQNAHQLASPWIERGVQPPEKKIKRAMVTVAARIDPRMLIELEFMGKKLKHRTMSRTMAMAIRYFIDNWTDKKGNHIKKERARNV